MNGNNKVISLFSINVDGDQNYQKYASRRKSSVVREIFDRIHSVLNRGEEEIDESIDGQFRLREQINIGDIVASNGQQLSVEANHYQRRGSSLTNSVKLPEESRKPPVEIRKWFVLVSSFVNMVIIGGFPFNMSVLFVEFLRAFGRSKAETSLVQSVCTGCILIGGIVTGTFVLKFGTRICGCCGALLSAIGIGVCFLATGLEFLIIFIGVMAGVGFSLNIICASTSISQNFSGKDKFIILSIVSTGSGIGGLISPLMLQYFTDMYGWRGCILIISGVVFNQFAGGLMSGPSRNIPTSKSSIPKKDHEDIDENNEPKHGCFSRFQTLLKNKVFLLYCFALAFALAPFNTFLVFFIDYFEEKGFDRSSVVWLYSGMNILTTLFRLIPGFMAQSPKIPKLAIPAIYSVIGFCSLALLPFVTSYVLNAIVIGCFGVGFGGVVTSMSITTMELVGDGNYPTAYGMGLATLGIVNTAGAPISGYIRDISGSYKYSVLSAAGSELLASAVFIIIAIYHTRNSKDPLSRFNREIEIQARRKSRRRSSILPWRRSVDLGFSL
ncbi:monocarboxylate transporter 13-like [Ostrea edulis]|uniref:monocarboxylate transporter 13-like n=1 Tax=Ostrea edulis TaxID=37623 RepID=UPI0024AEDA99|nr:monocarboxylate transporter 13-like [Ostrea edulis]